MYSKERLNEATESEQDLIKVREGPQSLNIDIFISKIELKDQDKGFLGKDDLAETDIKEDKHQVLHFYSSEILLFIIIAWIAFFLGFSFQDLM